MLGNWIYDPNKAEGEITSIEGLGLLDIFTEMGGNKTLVEVSGESALGFGNFKGYEMHIGHTAGPDCSRPFGKVGAKNIGAVSLDGKVSGSYLHGLFSNDPFRQALLSSIKNRDLSGIAYEQQVEEALDAVSLVFENSLDINGLLASARAF